MKDGGDSAADHSGQGTGPTNHRAANALLLEQTTEQRLAWSLVHLPAPQVVATGFGVESAVLLHMLARLAPGTPVLFLDSGYLYPETYRYVEQLREALGFSLSIVRPNMSAARQEARYGKLWTQGEDGLNTYRRLNRTEPLARALKQHGARTCFLDTGADFDAWGAELSDARKAEAAGEAVAPVLDQQNGIYRLRPLVDWSVDEITTYIEANALPLHPLADRLPQPIGDVHAVAHHDLAP